MLNRLSEFHERIVAVASGAELQLMAHDPSIEGLRVARHQMSRLLTAYQLFVHREIFEPLLARGSTSDAIRVRDVKAECLTLSEQVRAHTRYWTIDEVRTQWPSYRNAALGLIRRIQKQVRDVEQLGLRLAAIKAAPLALRIAVAG